LDDRRVRLRFDEPLPIGFEWTLDLGGRSLEGDEAYASWTYDVFDPSDVVHVSLGSACERFCDGSIQAPFATLDDGLEAAPRFGAVWIAEGVHEVQGVVVPPTTSLYGGFAEDFATHYPEVHPTFLVHSGVPIADTL